MTPLQPRLETRGRDGGPIYDLIESVMCRAPPAESRAAQVDAAARALVAAGLPLNDVPFVKRMPADRRAIVRDIYADLIARGVVRDERVDDSMLDAIERGAAAYDHGGRRTFIYPEEGRLLAALVDGLRPLRAVFLGSYYGYWARFAWEGLRAAGGQAVLVDPDPEVCAIARRNVAAAGLEATVEVVVATGQDYLAAGSPGPIELLVIDAEVQRDHPVPGIRGKGIYAVLLAAAVPHLGDDAILACHNILFADATGDPAFEAIIERNRTELAAFMDLAQREFDFVEYPTTEGVGIGRRRASG
jgi:predicted O-methyltransferase YrrM